MESYNWCAIWLFFSTAFIDSLVYEMVLQKSLHYNQDLDYQRRTKDHFYTPRWTLDGIFGINKEGDLFEFRYTDNLVRNRMTVLKLYNRSLEMERYFNKNATILPDPKNYTNRAVVVKRSMLETMVSPNRRAREKDDVVAKTTKDKSLGSTTMVESHHWGSPFKTASVDSVYFLKQMSIFYAISIMVNIITQVGCNEFKITLNEMCFINVFAQLCSVLAVILHIHNIQKLNLYFLAFTYGLNFFNLSRGKCPGKILNSLHTFCLEICQSFMALLSMAALYICQITVISLVHVLILMVLICWLIYKYCVETCPDHGDEENQNDSESNTPRSRVFYKPTEENVVIVRVPMEKKEKISVNLSADVASTIDANINGVDIMTQPLVINNSALMSAPPEIVVEPSVDPIEMRSNLLFRYYIYVIMASQVVVRMAAEIVPLFVITGVGHVFYAKSKHYMLIANMLYLWISLEWSMRLLCCTSKFVVSSAKILLLKLLLRSVCIITGAVLLFNATIDKWAVGVHTAIVLVALLRPIAPLVRRFIETELRQYQTIQLNRNCEFLLDYGHYLPLLCNFIFIGAINFTSEFGFFIAIQKIIFSLPTCFFAIIFSYRQFIL